MSLTEAAQSSVNFLALQMAMQMSGQLHSTGSKSGIISGQLHSTGSKSGIISGEDDFSKGISFEEPIDLIPALLDGEGHNINYVSAISIPHHDDGTWFHLLASISGVPPLFQNSSSLWNRDSCIPYLRGMM